MNSEFDEMYQIVKEDRKLLGNRIEAQLMRYIQEEPIPVGEKIPNEFELAEKFGVGRSTIREAVKGLVSQGMLEVRRGSGTYVISAYPAEEDPLGLGRYDDKYQLALELFDVRLMIEPEIAAYAAMNATEGDVAELHRLCNEVDNVTHRELMEETIHTHRAVVDAIERHDQVGARCAMVMHLTYNRQMIVKMLEQELEEQ